MAINGMAGRNVFSCETGSCLSQQVLHLSWLGFLILFGFVRHIFGRM